MGKYGLLDEAMREEEAYLRYLKFKEVEFPAVPDGEWHLYYRDLL